MNKIFVENTTFFRLGKKSFSIFIPLFFSQITYGVSTFISTLMISYLGKVELAALALASVVYSCLCAFFYGIFVSISILVSNHVGKNEHKEITTLITQGFFLAILCAVFFIVIMWLMPYLFTFTGQAKEIIPFATQYLQSLSWSALPWLLLVVIEQFLIGLSITKIIFFFSLFQVPLEIITNYVFVFGKLGFPRFGISGIGYGFTCIFSLSLLALGSYIALSEKTKHYHLFGNLKKLYIKKIVDILKLGLPIGSTNIVEYLVFPIVALLIGRFGIAALAAQQIAYQFFQIAITVGLALAQATTVQVGQAFGAGDLKKTVLYIYANLTIGISLIAIISFGYVFFYQQVISLDIDINNINSHEILFYAKHFLIAAALFQILDTIRLVIIGSLRGLKDTAPAMWITAVTYWIICLPLAYLFSFHLHLKAIGIWYGLIGGIFLGTLFLLIRLRLCLNRFSKISTI